MSRWLPRLRPAHVPSCGAWIAQPRLARRRRGVRKRAPCAGLLAEPSSGCRSGAERGCHRRARPRRALAAEPAGSVASLPELQLVAAARCAHLYGESPHDWWMAADWSATRPFVCAALPRALTAPLQQALDAAGVSARWHTSWSVACGDARQHVSLRSDGAPCARRPGSFLGTATKAASTASRPTRFARYARRRPQRNSGATG